MKVGVSLGISPREPITHTVDVVKNAEDLGFDSAWIADCQLSMQDCYSALPLCAVNTSSILLGTGVTNPVTRHPTTIACSFTAINQLSDGRARHRHRIGLDRGLFHRPQAGDHQAPGKVDQRHPHALRGRRGGRARRQPLPPGDPPPAASRFSSPPTTPKILQMSGRVADGGHPDGRRQRGVHVLADRPASGKGRRTSGGTSRTSSCTCGRRSGLGEDRDQARDDVSHWVASQAESFAKWKHTPSFLLPFVKDFKRASEAYDRHEHMSSHATHKTVVSPEFTDFVALVGTADECLERIRNLEKLGLEGITLAFRAGAGGRQARMEELSDKIIKHLK